MTSETNTNVEFRYGYTGRERDEETGLDYYRTRYYDSSVGRFISEDTIGFNGGDANLYRYVANNPINFNDPNGTDLYDFVNGADQLAAGFGDAVTFGGTTKLREAMYGETATRNHSGGLFTTGQVLGTGASIAVGVGAPNTLGRGVSIARRFAQGYTAVGAGVGSYQSTRHLLEGCFTPWDLLSYAPAIGFAGQRTLRGLRNLGRNVSPSTFVGRRNPIGNIGPDAPQTSSAYNNKPSSAGKHNPQLQNSPFQPTQNRPGTFEGRDYTGHAFDQMRNRGLTPTVVENAIKTGTRTPGNTSTTNVFHDSVNNITAIVNDSGKVITAY